MKALTLYTSTQIQDWYAVYKCCVKTTLNLKPLLFIFGTLLASWEMLRILLDHNLKLGIKFQPFKLQPSQNWHNSIFFILLKMSVFGFNHYKFLWPCEIINKCGGFRKKLYLSIKKFIWCVHLNGIFEILFHWIIGPW